MHIYTYIHTDKCTSAQTQIHRHTHRDTPALFIVNAFLNLIQRRRTIELRQWIYLDIVVQRPRLQSHFHVTAGSKDIVVKVSIQQEPLNDTVRHRQYTGNTHLQAQVSVLSVHGQYAPASTSVSLGSTRTIRTVSYTHLTLPTILRV